MKKIILITALITLFKVVKSQDIIVKNDSSKVQTVIHEIRTDCIKYSLFNYENGPTILLSKNEIAYVVYKNGITEHFTEVKKKSEPAYDKYNLDGSRPRVINEYTLVRKTKDLEALYKRKNYLGFNHLALLNSNISFSYMRDLKSEKFILHIPVSVGIGKPDMTNSSYNGTYLNYGSKNTYNLMNYQVGLGLLFSPSFGNSINFLIGPSFSFAQYDMSTKTTYMAASASQPNQFTTEEFKNNFILFRQQYGGSVGFLFRISAKLNMNVIANIGFKKDTYNKKDPFGIEYINSKTNYQREAGANVLPYANFLWSIGYRF
ncbi:MAG TPA: hypothetical protein VN026_12510 [Bacteroidia bacterium]|jgi:hypothetical protein|nr:hypothetical protein [Bacteroidia bacterium]